MTDPTLAATTILVVDDDRAFRVATRTLLEDEGYSVMLATNGEEALAVLGVTPVDLVITDMMMEKMTGLVLLSRLREKLPEVPVIMVTGFGSIQTAVEAMRLGAADYVTKPHNNDELLIKIRKTLQGRERDRELHQLRQELQSTYSYANIITRSPRMRDVLMQIRQVVDTDVTILVQGESGTGKELVARALHFNSMRKDAPFIATNCSALNEMLLESELFGYEKGAFTGATAQRRGRFEEAHTGTLFLDEIGDITPGVQKKLLRVLQEKTFERVGGSTPITVDTRVVVATNRTLEVMVREGDFREDLFYRLNVFPITLPPLRERLEDVPLLVEAFLQKHGGLAGGRVRSILPEAVSAMMRHPWKGNIRELENLVKRAIIKCPGDTILAVDLPEVQEGDGEQAGTPGVPGDWTAPYKEYLGAVLRNAEERYLVRMLRLHRGNINQIARLMEVDRKTVYRKMADLGIVPDKYRD
ncbi:MAG: sigma-54-dependent Fis family transcriptional regulator [Ignavibacteriae bacterium]|nr:sigma-54-dependent Fis family transcriptional regulator [Ignavibacteriota bacterium]